MNAPRPRLRDRLCVAGFLLLWIVPSAWHGLSRARLSFEPARLHDWHDIACLFPNRPSTWNLYYIEVRRAGHLSWEQLDEREFFALEPFGHRTRLHRYLVAWGPDRRRGHDEVAAWLVARDREVRPGTAPIVALRVVWTWHTPTPEDPPEGAWRQPPLAAVPPDRRRIFTLHEFPEGGAP